MTESLDLLDEHDDRGGLLVQVGETVLLELQGPTGTYQCLVMPCWTNRSHVPGARDAQGTDLARPSARATPVDLVQVSVGRHLDHRPGARSAGTFHGVLGPFPGIGRALPQVSAFLEVCYLGDLEPSQEALDAADRRGLDVRFPLQGHTWALRCHAQGNQRLVAVLVDDRAQQSFSAGLIDFLDQGEAQP